MVFAFRITELELGLQCRGLDWCFVYVEQRWEVMLSIKQFRAIGLTQCVDVKYRVYAANQYMPCFVGI
jgi:hypothetical protein